MTRPVDALARVRHLYENRGQRARELKGGGRRIIGYFCCYPPVEMLTALELVPYRVQGSTSRSIREGDAYLESNVCSFMRSCFDLAVSGSYDYLDGLIVPHSCDTVQRIDDIWRRHKKLAFHHMLDVPHMIQPSSYVFFKQELRRLQTALEAFAGMKLDAPRLREAIALHNQNRALLRQLYALRRADSPPISGRDVVKLLVAGMGLPVAEYSTLIRDLIVQVQQRPTNTASGRPRLLVMGSELDDVAFIDLLEDAGGDVVIDDLCTGTRSFWPDVPITDDPLDGLAKRYLDGINCPRTYRSQQQPRAADLENRFGYLHTFAREFRVDGVVMHILRFCDTHELDAPDIIEYFAAKGIPTLHLEAEYRMTNVGQIRTRVEAFLETLGEVG